MASVTLENALRSSIFELDLRLYVVATAFYVPADGVFFNGRGQKYYRKEIRNNIFKSQNSH